MSPEQKSRIVTVLRTTTKKQHIGGLHKPSTGAVCAMGVIFENHPDFGCWDGNWPVDRAGKLFILREYRDFGLTREQYLMIEKMNDVQERSFSEIADYIEANW